jgi:glycosyltransferase involved in cell wall biosynthesis
VGQEARALADAGYEVTTISPTGLGYEAADERLHGVRALRFRAPPSVPGIGGYLREYGTSLWGIARLSRMVAREQPVDVVIVATPPDFLVALALPLRRRGAAVIFDQRDPGPELFEAKFGRRGLLYRLLLASERFAFSRADVVMPHNESCAELALGRGRVDPERIFIVGVGPDPRRIFPVPARPELRRGKRFLVLWMGTMSTQEGLQHLIDAADHLVNRCQRDDIAFSIVGPGDARAPLLAEVQRRGLEEAVDLPGPITDDDELRAYMATADVCLSVDEQNPMNDRSTMMKVLEYMAMGRPVIQFPLAEMRRLCGGDTLYARNADAGDLAAKIVELLDDPRRREELGRSARRRVLDGMMWSDQVPVLVNAVESAIQCRSLSTRGLRARTAPGS